MAFDVPSLAIYTVSMGFFQNSTEICQFKILPITLFKQLAKYLIIPVLYIALQGQYAFFSVFQYFHVYFVV